MFRVAVALTVLLAIVTLAQSADKPKDGPATLEQKLHGAWVGGPCMGELTLGADGTFERQHFSPGNFHLKGTWAIRWDALPPTLVLACKTSDDPDEVGKTTEVKIVELNDEALAYVYPGTDDKTTYRYERVKKDRGTQKTE